MAKITSSGKVSGTVGEYTYVRSRKYGDHIRAKRGTYKKAKLNKPFERQTKKIPGANRHAKIFKDAIDPHRKGFEDGTMWSRLISMFMRQFDADGAFDFRTLRPFDINKKNTFMKLMELTPEVKADKKKSVLEVNLSYPVHPPLKKVRYLNGYRFTVVGVFPDVKKNRARTAVSFSDIISLSEKVAPLNVQLPVPRRAKTFLVCIRIDGCRNGTVDGPQTTKAMRMVGAGEI